jgi:hypothetical protein
MPAESFLELNAPRHVRLPSSASEHTRYLRMAATVAPYIGNGVAAAPRLGWKSPELSAQARLVAPLYGILNSLYPNRR